MKAKPKTFERTLYAVLAAGVGSTSDNIPVANARLTGIQLTGILSYSATSYGLAYVCTNQIAAWATNVDNMIAGLYLAASQNAAGNSTDSIYVPQNIVYGKFPERLYLNLYSSAVGTSINVMAVCFFEDLV